jgi:hypothetical protein
MTVSGSAVEVMSARPLTGPTGPLLDGTRTLVTILIPTLREAADVAGCIDAIGAQDYPLRAIEVVVVDGCSDDGTAAVAEEAAAAYGFAAMRVVPSPRRRTAVGLNLGLSEATGELIVRVDARARIPADYVRTCVDLLDAEPTIGVVGGAQTPRARTARLADRGIARGLDNRIATGLSRYRRSNRSGPADTVWMGVFRTDELQALGGWTEELTVGEDWDLNRRYRLSGSTVWFASQLSSGYLPRTSYTQLARQYFTFGRGKGRAWSSGTRPEPRQVGLLGAPAVGLAIWIVLLRRLGPPGLLLLPAGFLIVDHAGSRGPAGVPERVASSAAVAVFSGAWWIGALIGLMGASVER